MWYFNRMLSITMKYICMDPINLKILILQSSWFRNIIREYKLLCCSFGHYVLARHACAKSSFSSIQLWHLWLYTNLATKFHIRHMAGKAKELEFVLSVHCSHIQSYLCVNEVMMYWEMMLLGVQLNDSRPSSSILPPHLFWPPLISHHIRSNGGKSFTYLSVAIQLIKRHRPWVHQVGSKSLCSRMTKNESR